MSEIEVHSFIQCCEFPWPEIPSPALPNTEPGMTDDSIGKRLEDVAPETKNSYPR